MLPLWRCFRWNAPKWRQVGAINKGRPGVTSEDDFDDDELEQALNSVQLVSVALIISETKCTNFVQLNCLLDTGSPVSFIKKSMVPEEIQIGRLSYSNYRGLGEINICTYGTLSCYIEMAEKVNRISVLIISDEITPMPMLIGMYYRFLTQTDIPFPQDQFVHQIPINICY